MKTKIYLIALVLISSLISSCSSDDELNYQNDFEKSEKAWLDFKESSSNSYKYTVSEGSVFLDYGWETTITVSNGKIIQRHFKYTGNTENIPDNVPLEWTEEENQINSHENSPAAAALTLDQIYNKAEKEWLIKRKDATVYFEAKNNGLISSCGYVPKGCMDDCFFGIRIKSVNPYLNER
ncbi:hypothetical protein [Flavobacterium hydrophilum]|uniref:Uncharacterized protein n=1 Tax=Flavobacterium hydrophilum TaxID=2211445 RepID=A0A2V4BY47_9FLAO|nr:hypothetical protein [Flavobacterium hydrophilum]PXY43928.1 hypothetical protein DMB68_15900 [Flavobacterium hydrophilum]